MRRTTRSFAFAAMIASVMMLLLSASFVVHAEEGTPATSDPVPQIAEPEQSVTPSPITEPPTAAPTVDVSPTAVSTAEPTAELLPEATLTPTLTLSDAQPTPTFILTPVDVAPTPSPTPTNVPPTPIPVTNTDTVVADSLNTQATVSPGSAHTIDFSYSVTTSRTGTLIAAELRGSSGATPDGWVLAAPGVSSSGPVVTITDSTALEPGTAFPLSLTITAPSQVSSEQTVQLFVRGIELTRQGDLATPVMGETPLVSVTVVPPPTAPLTTDFHLGCDLSTVTSGVGDASEMVSCRFQGLETLNTRTVTLTQVTVIAPSGWEVSGAASSMTLAPDQLIGADAEYDFSFAVAPVSCDAVSGVIQLSSQIEFDGAGALVGPATSLVATVNRPPTSLPMVDATFLGFSTSKWSRDGFPASTGAIAMTITPTDDPACPGPESRWSLQVSSTGLTSTSHPNVVIPPENITYLGSHSVDAAPEGLVPLATDVQLAGSQPVTIATGDGTLETGGTWTAQFQVLPPGNAAPGIYSGSVDVVVVGAP